MTAREYDANGWFEVVDNPISKVGVYPYSGAQIGAPAADAGRVFRVLRPPEELSDPEAMASFRLMPIIDDHTMLGDDLTAPEEKGVAGVIGESVSFKDGTLFANLKIFGKALAEKIRQGKTELSCGYRCAYEFTRGVWEGQEFDVIQRNIRANHLAVVDEGRMGPEVAILDQLKFTVDAMEVPAMDEDLKKILEAIMKRLEALEAVKVEAKVEDEEAEAKAEDEEAEAKAEDEEAEAKAEDEEAEAKAEDEEAEAEAKADAMDARLKRLERVAMDEAAWTARAAKKSALVAKLVPLIGAFDHASMTTAQVEAYGVKKLGLRGVPKGAESIALDAALQTAQAPKPVSAMDGAERGGLSKSLAAYAAGRK